MNGHGGNSPARARLQEVNNELRGLQLNWYDWWLSHSVDAIAVKHQLKPSHANWLEAFTFTRVGDLPSGSKTPPFVPSAIMDAESAKRVYGDGSFGGPYSAGDDIMHELFAACLADILQLLKFESAS